MALQEKHEVVLDVQDAIEALDPEFGVLDEELQVAANEFEGHQTRAQEADQRRQELEGKIESYRIMQERRHQKLEWVRGAKEASTLMAELDLARSVLAREEAEWIRSADKVQEMEKLAAESEKAVQAVQETQAPKREELEAKRTGLAEELARAKEEEAEVAKSVKPQLQERFRRILRGRARLALYPLTGGACGHCFTAVPLHRVQQIKSGKGIEACEACGVLVYQAAESPSTAEAEG